MKKGGVNRHTIPVGLAEYASNFMGFHTCIMIQFTLVLQIYIYVKAKLFWYFSIYIYYIYKRLEGFVKQHQVHKTKW